MATLALSAVGSAVGSALLPSGLSFLGATLTGAAIGQQVGALVGSQIDQALFGAAGRQRAVDGPRVSELRVTSSTEGAPVPRVYGHARVGGQLIWATALEEEAVGRSASGSGKGGRSGGATGSDYAYFANFAIALAEGEITSIGRVWADNREIDISNFTTRLYRGTQTQDADQLILAKQGGDAPTYRGIAYIVFEHLPLADFGNRIPQFSFEVSRAVDRLEAKIQGVVVIPGSGEFVYGREPVNRIVGRATTTSENVQTKLGGTNWSVSMDQLQSSLPNARSVSLVVSWFGNDLRAGNCELQPRVERHDRITSPLSWSVAGLERATATPVSTHDGRAAYGGTPSDQTVIDAIRDLTARAMKVVFSPFILLDIPNDNTRPDPYSSAASQPPYPWRGRITVSPASGQFGTVDKTIAAHTQLHTFIGTALPSDFTVTDGAVHYAGPAEWSFRRFILHYAHLCKVAGGVDTFVLCSELRGLTTTRDSATTYPFVAALQQLASEVRVILGPATKITYAADWSEYFGHQPADGSGDVNFHLDPLWASPHIDAIGIDVYWPLADWRDGDAHLDIELADGPHDIAYLKRNLTAGEGFDWYYASSADRITQTRSPITDSLGKPWIYRFKDIKSWWSNAHHNRQGGIESATPTAWLPQSKPFWFMEIGCPAIDKGANQPNVFIDSKSAESALPHFSTGTRDDLIQRRVLQAFIEGFDASELATPTSANPLSAVTGARMVDVARSHVYAWDARPYPAFPNHNEIWRDAINWPRGHWINGRATSAPVPSLVASILEDFGFTDFDTSRLTGTAGGLVIDRIMSAREALQPLELAFFFDVLESGGLLRFQPRGSARTGVILEVADLAETRSGSDLLRMTRAQEADLPQSAKIAFISSASDYPQALAEAKRTAGASDRVASAGLGLVLNPLDADAIADSWLFETWSARERAAFTLPPSQLALEPGDVITVRTSARDYPLRLTEVGDHGARDVEALTFDAGVYGRNAATPREQPALRPVTVGQPLVTFLDIPPSDGAEQHTGSVAITQEPWPGTIAVFVSPELSGFKLTNLITRAATTGVTVSEFRANAPARLDYATSMLVELDRGALSSVTMLALLAGANMAAIETAPNVWEILQFQFAELIGPRTYRLTSFLRGQRGTDQLIELNVPASARFILLDEAVTAVDMGPEDIGLTLNWLAGPARRDISDTSYITLQQRFTGQGLKPFAPVHIRASRNAIGDITLNWVRRARTNGDSWENADVPLDESEERYEVDILDGASTRRTLLTLLPTATYTAAQQIADFGAVQSSLTLRVAQISPTTGRGHARTLTL